jgi:guanylate kinase
MLLKEFPDVVASISYTTRPPREGEIQGKHYHFVSNTQFESMVDAGDFLEYVELYGYYYGTSKRWVEEQLSQGKHVFLVIDTQGALKIKETIEGVFIFMVPPSLEELKKRLLQRKTEDKETIEARLEWAQKEFAAASHYDYLIVNDDLRTTYEVLRSILIAEEHRVNK